MVSSDISEVSSLMTALQRTTKMMISVETIFRRDSRSRALQKSNKTLQALQLGKHQDKSLLGTGKHRAPLHWVSTGMADSEVHRIQRASVGKLWFQITSINSKKRSKYEKNILPSMSWVLYVFTLGNPLTPSDSTCTQKHATAPGIWLPRPPPFQARRPWPTLLLK